MNKNRSDGVETRNRLLGVAGEIFAAMGFHDTKVAHICRRAGANVAAVNYYFGSKEELYVAAWRHAFETSIAANPPDGGVAADAPAEDRLRGQILALVRRIMDPASLDCAIAHKEMANPTGLLSEVMRRSIEPLHQRFRAVVRELLGDSVSEQQVRLCEMSIHAQCFAPLIHAHHRRVCGGGKPPCLQGPDMDVNVLVGHVFEFSIAGIRSLRRGFASKKKQRKNERKA